MEFALGKNLAVMCQRFVPTGQFGDRTRDDVAWTNLNTGAIASESGKGSPRSSVGTDLDEPRTTPCAAFTPCRRRPVLHRLSDRWVAVAARAH